MWDVLQDAVSDSLKIFPFLFLIYIVLEIVESGGYAAKIQKLLSGKFAPAVGALAGIVPECGFSAMYAKLYDNRLITTGTLLAIFLSASDEGLIVLLAGGTPVWQTLLLVAIKFVYGVAVGYLVNFLLRKRETPAAAEKIGFCAECGEKPEGTWEKYFFHPLLHALRIFVFVLAVNLVFGVVIYFIGEDNMAAFLDKNAALQPLVAALVGLIPNCSASVLLAQSYALGAINFAALAAGLAANAGVALALVFKTKARWKKNLFVLGALFISSLVLGYLLLIFV